MAFRPVRVIVGVLVTASAAVAPAATAAGAAASGTDRPVGATVNVAVNTAGAPYWRGWDIVRGVMLRHGGSGGYTVDAWGGLHPWGGAPQMFPSAPYTPGHPWVTGAALTDDDAGGLLVGPKAGGGTPWSWGFGGFGLNVGLPGFFNLGGPPEPVSIGFADTVNGSSWASGVIATGSGGISRFLNGRMIDTAGSPAWPGWEIVHGIAVKGDGSGGFVLDGFGGIHPFGSARVLTSTGYWRGWDIARGLAIDGHGHGEVVDAWGGLHPFTYA